jgi:hypothetical protein
MSSKKEDGKYKYTSINVKREQHQELTMISEMTGLKITELGIAMADAYIENFKIQNADALEEMRGLQARKELLKSQMLNNKN